jgi:hypothetical protein
MSGMKAPVLFCVPNLSWLRLVQFQRGTFRTKNPPPPPTATQSERGGGGTASLLRLCSAVLLAWQSPTILVLCVRNAAAAAPPPPLKLVPRFPADGSTNFTILNLFSSITHTRPIIYADTFDAFWFSLLYLVGVLLGGNISYKNDLVETEQRRPVSTHCSEVQTCIL